MNIIVINGMHRSGTMLLSRLINELPDTFIIKDGFRIPWLYFRVETNDAFRYPEGCYGNTSSVDLNRKVRDVSLLKRILTDEAGSYSFPPRMMENWQAQIEGVKDGETYFEVFYGLHKRLADASGMAYVGAKNTHMFRYADSLLDIFPMLKWIDIVRDPRGWYCSSKVTHPSSVLLSTLRWNAAFKATMANAKKYRGRYLVVTFEDLILDKIKTLQRIADFIGMNFLVTPDWAVNLSLHENDGSPWYPNPSYTITGERVLGDQNKRKSTDYALFDTVPIYRWREKLSTLEKMAIYILSGTKLKQMRKMHNL